MDFDHPPHRHSIPRGGMKCRNGRVAAADVDQNTDMLVAVAP